MSIWREFVDPTTEGEIDVVVRAAVEVVQSRLAAGRPVRPCMVASRPDTTVAICEDKDGYRNNGLADEVRADPSRFRVVAYLVDDDVRDEIQIGVEHCTGVALTVVGPYQHDLDTGRRTFGEFHSELAEATLYGTEDVSIVI